MAYQSQLRVHQDLRNVPNTIGIGQWRERCIFGITGPLECGLEIGDVLAVDQVICTTVARLDLGKDFMDFRSRLAD